MSGRLAVQTGANVEAVQSMLGHASAAMTLDLSAGLFGDGLDAVADRLDEAAARARADHLRTAAQTATRLRSFSEVHMPVDLVIYLVGRAGLEPATQGL
jgi:hypothetical protein